MQTFTAVVPAAGRGSRMQANMPKQYLPLGDKTIIEHTLTRLLAHPQIEKIVVVIAADDHHFSSLPLASHPKIEVTIGGPERAISVLNGLSCVETDWVLVHDAARPCITLADLDTLVSAIDQGEDGAILAIPVKDTMKRADISNRIELTVERGHLWHALTPQMFPTQQLADAIDAGLAQSIVLTDEASAMELAGFKPLLITGRADNIKVTQPEDLALAAFILQQQERA
ncbi:MAG: 2-C-methyl-D-erythritol 4-phosphate cytidylyltransferase [Gammaproteobacteria bacterium]|uniref:2-C-methyl-D-erythritol 4-phosphate cytidylyltransferase n=1 Tax=Tolumonas osonensis TaxID=675874 RepID=A0A841GKL0_9GAMM|nr:2-C-methyl-D-erythritol 4-phosphate cytidylyltransferase [Tolumonas osonensis]MBB6055330.1 2-C-methyl-D-erythritol 4-phosphate cytidylyltransferase [Tolumonas osonensis]NCB59044.1 2-C-methyl-D-erythritol 4-phosphate cytidylyltransferase [Gammaproteobacteria bacterium]